jgi:hypothetical protein
VANALYAQPYHGTVATEIKVVITRISELDQELHKVKNGLKGWVKLYYSVTTDSWGLWEMTGPTRSRYVGLNISETMLTALPGNDRQWLVEAVTLITERWRLKRALRVIATLVEVALLWPGGKWQLRGEGGNRTAAKWVTIATEFGLMPLGRESEGKQTDDEIEEVLEED